MRSRNLLSGTLLLAATLGAALAAGCGAYNYDGPSSVVASVSLAVATNPLEVGQATIATSSARDQYGAPVIGDAPTYSSSAPEIAGVNPVTGAILAVAPGVAEITVTIQGKADRRPVTVIAAAVRINEVRPNGDLPGGWIELFNPTGIDVDLSGWSISGGDVRQSFVIPAGARILARDFLIVSEQTLPVSLKAADAVHLFSRFGVQVDQISWTTDPITSIGRCPDGTGPFVLTTLATRRALNACPGEAQ
jgi:hypothetical protein